MAVPGWLIHGAVLAGMATLIALAYLGLEVDSTGFWPPSYQRGSYEP